MVNATVPTVGWEVWVTKRFYVRMRMYIMLAIPIVHFSIFATELGLFDLSLFDVILELCKFNFLFKRDDII